MSESRLHKESRDAGVCSPEHSVPPPPPACSGALCRCTSCQESVSVQNTSPMDFQSTCTQSVSVLLPAWGDGCYPLTPPQTSLWGWMCCSARRPCFAPELGEFPGDKARLFGFVNDCCLNEIPVGGWRVGSFAERWDCVSAAAPTRPRPWGPGSGRDAGDGTTKLRVRWKQRLLVSKSPDVLGQMCQCTRLGH